MEPVHALLRLADHDHLLLLKLVDAVHATLLNAVCAHFLPEARGIAGEGLGELLLRQNGIDELADHRVFAGADEVQILALDLVHHALHLRKGHDAGNNLAADHERRNVVRKALVDHEVTGICQNGGVQACDIAAQIVKAVAAGVTGSVDVDAVELLHDVHVIGHLEFRHERIAEALDLHVFGIVLADGHGIVDEVRDDQHDLTDSCGQLGLLLFQSLQLFADGADLSLDCLSLFLFALTHEGADLLADGLPLAAQLVALHLCLTELPVQLYHFVYQRQLFVLELLSDVLLDFFRIIPDPFDVDHDSFLPLLQWFYPQNCVIEMLPMKGCSS